MGNEEQLISWLQRLQSRDLQPGSALSLPGDDVAILGHGTGNLAITVDQQIAGVHVPADLDPAVWAHRLLAVNLSDLAAAGAEPTAALSTLAVPPDFDLRRFLRAAVERCRKFGIPLIGGDVARAPTAVTTMTLIGRRPSRGRWLARSAAQPGDSLWLGGSVGTSAAGQRLVARGARLASNRVSLPAAIDLPTKLLPAARRAVRRHLLPAPQLELGRWLGGRRRAAVIDVSDGLAKDLHRLCAASGVGAEVEQAAIIIDNDLPELAQAVGSNALELALAGGEDYVLLFALPQRSRPPAEFGSRRIGKITASPAIRLIETGASRQLPPGGWDHIENR